MRIRQCKKKIRMVTRGISIQLSVPVNIGVASKQISFWLRTNYNYRWSDIVTIFMKSRCQESINGALVNQLKILNGNIS